MIKSTFKQIAAEQKADIDSEDRDWFLNSALIHAPAKLQLSARSSGEDTKNPSPCS